MIANWRAACSADPLLYAVKAVVDAGHEIAHHGWKHVSPSAYSREEEEAELVRANAAIKRISGQYARGYRSPSWDLSAHSVELFLKHGFTYDSSMMLEKLIRKLKDNGAVFQRMDETVEEFRRRVPPQEKKQ